MSGFGALVRAEFTKFRTVRGWVGGAVAAVLVTLALGGLFVAGTQMSCGDGPCKPPPQSRDGKPVTDKFYFLHRTLDGDGTLTARLASMTGVVSGGSPTDAPVARLVPWAKAGLIVRDGAKPGGTYAAVALTGSHGVRFQHDYTGDDGGSGAASGPRWLRLVRSGSTVTGYESGDGVAWHRVGVATLSGLPSRVEVGLFATSPGEISVISNSAGGRAARIQGTVATGVFDHVVVPGGAWQRSDVGALDDPQRPPEAQVSGATMSGDTVTIRGSGDIAPAGDEVGVPLERTLTGISMLLIVLTVVAVLFVTAEYRRGLIDLTFLASPRRGRAITAKAVVTGGIGFVVGLLGAGILVPVAMAMFHAKDVYVIPVAAFTEARVILGVAALCGLAAVLAMALGTVIRRGVLGVVAALAVVVLPHMIATISLLPEGATNWLLRASPAAGFAITQTLEKYPQVTRDYSAAAGYFPLSPWAGLAVLAAFAAAALGWAAYRVRP